MSWDTSLVDGPILSYQSSTYNVNVAPQAMTPELEPFVVEPVYPKRVFAGDDPANRTMTVCLLFADEEEARAHLASYWIEN